MPINKLILGDNLKILKQLEGVDNNGLLPY